MGRTFSVRKRLILVGLGVLLAGDLALAAYSWHTSTSVRTPMARLDADSRKLGLLKADIDRAEKIQHDLPTTIADYDRFDASFLSASTGNSAVTAELDELAKKSGLQIQSLSFRHKELAGRNLTQVELDILVSGDYANIVKFMNNLQRSPNFYIVDSLSLQAEGQSDPRALRIGLHVKTFLRTAS